MRLRRRLGGEYYQRAAARLMEYTLVGLLFVGVDRHDPRIVVNAAVTLLIVQLPPLLERDYEIPMDAGLTLWITAAAFLHALGIVGLPGTELAFYDQVFWWDHLTHALSASVVAAAGYATVRALDEHTEALSLPPRFVSVFLVLFVVAFGVLWEVLEFGLALAGETVGWTVLVQYGVEDTMLDLVFDVGGAVAVAFWGTARLTGVVRALTDRLGERRETG